MSREEEDEGGDSEVGPSLRPFRVLDDFVISVRLYFFFLVRDAEFVSHVSVEDVEGPFVVHYGFECVFCYFGEVL